MEDEKRLSKIRKVFITVVFLLVVFFVLLSNSQTLSQMVGNFLANTISRPKTIEVFNPKVEKTTLLKGDELKEFLKSDDDLAPLIRQIVASSSATIKPKPE